MSLVEVWAYGTGAGKLSDRLLCCHLVYIYRDRERVVIEYSGPHYQSVVDIYALVRGEFLACLCRTPTRIPFTQVDRALSSQEVQ